MLYDLRGKRAFVAGHNGLAGSAIVRRLGREGCEVLTQPRSALDLREPRAVTDFLRQAHPHVVIVAAGRVGGIAANVAGPAAFLSDNLRIADSIISAAYTAGVEKLLYLGSSCAYPRLAPQPITEEALLSGSLEPTNEPYALAKIVGVKLCQAYRRQYRADFIALTPTNLYGPGDNFHPDHSHLPAALIRRFHEAHERRESSVTVWGTGGPFRELLYVDDLADACVFALQYYSGEVALNVGTGKDIRVSDFAAKVQRVIGFKGELRYDATRPDGAPRKLLDVSRLNALGWQARTSLDQGLALTYEWFKENVSNVRTS